MSSDGHIILPQLFYIQNNATMNGPVHICSLDPFNNKIKFRLLDIAFWPSFHIYIICNVLHYFFVTKNMYNHLMKYHVISLLLVY